MIRDLLILMTLCFHPCAAEVTVGCTTSSALVSQRTVADSICSLDMTGNIRRARRLLAMRFAQGISRRPLCPVV